MRRRIGLSSTGAWYSGRCPTSHGPGRRTFSSVLGLMGGLSLETWLRSDLCNSSSIVSRHWRDAFVTNLKSGFCFFLKAWPPLFDEAGAGGGAHVAWARGLGVVTVDDPLLESGSPPVKGMLQDFEKVAYPLSKGCYTARKKWLTPCARDVTGFRKSVTSFFGSSTWLTPCATGLFRRIGTRDLELLRLEIGLGVVKKLSQRRRKAARG